jgi:putative membrane protein
MTSTPAKPPDTGTRLAVERTRLAYERTLMAWIRTALSLISFGFTIYKFFEFESGKGEIAAVSSRVISPRQFGILMISTGLVALALATFDHQRNEHRLQQEFGIGSRSVSVIVGIIVAFVGLLALTAAFFRG